jgi:beta-lactamase class A
MVVKLDTTKAEKFFNDELRPIINTEPTITKITTLDLIEISRDDGQPGQTLDDVATGEAIVEYLLGRSQNILAVAKYVPPKIEYTRTYSSSDEGLTAMIKNYAEDHKGQFGIKLVEMTGARRQTGFNEDLQFTTASTYKLFVAYGALHKVEIGQWYWEDPVSGGRNLATCFEDMIAKSDNPCAEALLRRYGTGELTSDIQALGLSELSGWINGSPTTTAADLSLFLTILESGQIQLTQSSRSRLIEAMKRNVYRSGIPAGVGGTVADKVGFLNGLLHDAAIVYAPTGTYVLTILTDGSSWSAIAELASKVKEML